MALPSSGTITMANVNQELGRASPYNQQVALNDSVVRTLFGPPGSPVVGAISMSMGYSRSNYNNVATFTAQTTTNWTVPTGVYSIWVKMWGAGGRGGSTNSPGGGGGFINGYLAVTPGNTVKIYCGGGGYYDDYPEDCNNATSGANVTLGGRAPVVYYNGSTYMIAGSGGAGANSYSNTAGGAGGGTNGVNGATGSTTGGGGGQGATGGSGGTAGGCNNTDGPSHSAPTLSSGYIVYSDYGGDAPANCGCDYCAVCNSDGSGGGGGYAGGGGAEGYAGGGGGSSGHSNFTNVTNTAGSGATPGGTGDSNYNASYGGGGASGVNGEQSYVVIRY